MPKIKELIQPPPEPEGDGEQQIAALRDYLVKITQELYYLLTHLEADNINDSTFQKISEMIPRPYVGLPRMDGDPSSGQSSQWARGDHRHGHDSIKADVTALEAHKADTDNPHSVTKAQVGLGNVANERQYSAQNPPPIPTPGEVGAVPVTREINGHALSADVTLDHTDVGAIPAAAKGSAGGVAELDSNGMVPSSQLPSYVDDVLEYASLSAFPVTGEGGKIYVALDTNRTYRWSGSAYVEISESLALGETSSTAYRGDRGKTAYDHSQTTGNPHGTTAADIGALPADGTAVNAETLSVSHTISGGAGWYQFFEDTVSEGTSRNYVFLITNTYNRQSGILLIYVNRPSGSVTVDARILSGEIPADSVRWEYTTSLNLYIRKDSGAAGYIQFRVMSNAARTGNPINLAARWKASAVSEPTTAVSTVADVLRFTAQAISAGSNQQILSISNAAITADHVLARIEFANPKYITEPYSWLTADGSFTLTGTATAATTANILLVRKGN